MKLKLQVVSLILALVTPALQASEIAEARLVISPLLSNEHLQDAQDRLLAAALDPRGSRPGARLLIFDGWELRSVADLAVPRLASDSAAGRKRKLAPELAKLLQWFERARAAQPALKGSGLLDVPRAMDLVSRNLPASSSLTFIGSPVYINQAEPQFSFYRPEKPEECWFPSDGHIAVSREASPFGLAGSEQRLAGASARFLYPSESIFPTALYREQLLRFWALYFSEQGAGLSQFSSDKAEAFKTLFSREPERFRFQMNPEMARLQMLRVIRTNEFVTITNGALRGNIAAPLSAGERSILQSFEASAAGSEISIGIMWDTPGVDLDLWVWTDAASPPLFWDNKSSPHGEYLKDYQDANNALEWEQVNLRNVRLGNVRAYANLYAAQGSGLQRPVEGKVLLRHGGETVIKEFAIDALAGNKGANQTRRDSSPHWKRLELAAAPAVRPEPQAQLASAASLDSSGALSDLQTQDGPDSSAISARPGPGSVKRPETKAKLAP